MSIDPRRPFERAEQLDKPGIIGARWWQDSLKSAPDAGRRRALGILVGVGLAVGAMAVVAHSFSSASDDGTSTAPRPSLEMQRDYGWSFGAVTESLTFDGQSTKPFDRAALSRLSADLAPARNEHRPFYVPTLFESPTAQPRKSLPDSTEKSAPLAEALRPIFTKPMDVAYHAGKSLASLFNAVKAKVALVVDLAGPESVALAAGAAEVFDPVFTFDNWPHPRGVVPAHLTLAAAAYYQPLFAKKNASDKAASPLFALDRRRLDAYTDDTTQFDNRHVGRLPNAAALKALGVAHVLYVTPTLFDSAELDDLNDDLCADAAAGLSVRMVSAAAYKPASDIVAPMEDPQPYFYGGSDGTHLGFFLDYAYASPPAGKPARSPSLLDVNRNWRPAPRATPFSSGRPKGGGRPLPVAFGTVPVVIGAGGIILGSVWSRSGSWNRSSGGWGG